jgi:hypothetical protein
MEQKLLDLLQLPREVLAVSNLELTPDKKINLKGEKE